MDEWASKVKEMTPKLKKEHAYMDDTGIKNVDLYSSDSFNDFEGLITDHINREETWIFPFLVENNIYDERPEEIASQHPEITSMLTELRHVRGEEFKKRFLELLNLLQRQTLVRRNGFFPG